MVRASGANNREMSEISNAMLCISIYREYIRFLAVKPLSRHVSLRDTCHDIRETPVLNMERTV